MNFWILVLVFVSGSGTAAVSIPSYSSLDTCKAAAVEAKQHNSVADAFCLQGDSGMPGR